MTGMIQNRTTLLLVACCLLTVSAQRPGFAQGGVTEEYTCASWTPVLEDKKGTRRILLPMILERAGKLVQRPGSYSEGGVTRPGLFVFPDEVMVGLLTEPDGKDFAVRFTTRTATKVEFHPELPGNRNKFGPPIRVQGGVFSPFPFPMTFFIHCVKGDSNDRLEEADSGKAVIADPGSINELLKRSTEPKTESRLADRFADKKIETPSPGAIVAPPSERPSSVEKAAPGPGPTDPDEKTATLTPDVLTSASVCSARTLEPLALLKDAKLTSPQTVGRRNTATETKGLDYLDVSGDAIPLNTSFDIADSAGKLIPYEAVAARRRRP